MRANSNARSGRGSAATFDVVHAPILRFFPALVSELGGVPEPLLAAVGLDPAHLLDAPYGRIAALLEHSAAVLDCPDFGLRLARRQGGASMFGPLGLVMRNSRRFADAHRAMEAGGLRGRGVIVF